MLVEATTPITYSLICDQEKILLNGYLGKQLKLKFTGQIQCAGCDRSIKKSYNEGFCFPCTQTRACCDLCIVKPERCHYHLNTCREPTWGQSYCMVPHIVYLANTSSLKVGITRKTQAMTRWIDQGAHSALPLFEVATRQISGFVEILFAKKVADKTNWRQMLKGEVQDIDLKTSAIELTKTLEADFSVIHAKYGETAIKRIQDSAVHHFQYPVIEYPEKIVSLSFDKTSNIEGTLLGIKGQYLIFDIGVINIRKHSGYIVEINE